MVAIGFRQRSHVILAPACSDSSPEILVLMASLVSRHFAGLSHPPSRTWSPQALCLVHRPEKRKILMKLADRSAMARLFADEKSAEWHTAIWSGFQSIYSDIDQWEITIASQVNPLSLLRAPSLGLDSTA